MLRKYKSEKGDDLYVTAFVGEELENCDNRNWVQLTIGNKFVQLSPYQIRDLIWILEGRLNGILTATGDEMYPYKTIDKYGSVIEKEDD